MKKYLVLIFFLYSVVVMGNEPLGNYYWVQFNSKANTPYSLGEPELYLSSRAIDRRNSQNIAIDSTDLPVDPTYIDSLNSLGFFVKHTSKWMNGAIVVLDHNININSVFKPSFVSEYQIRKNDLFKSASNKFSDIDTLYQVLYGNSYTQVSMINGQLLHEVSKGEGVHVAVIDAGFSNADNLSAFDSLFARDGVLGTFDFVHPGNNVYNEYYHGTAVLSIMASYQPEKLIGTAPAASYWLLRSEDVATEYPVEEDYWIVAAEFADSVGCDVINTSLGYTTFDNPEFDHNYSEFDGKTLRISRAANLAADKGMVLVCSAGNSGNDSWGHIVAPSEAEKVLSVAAVNNLKEIVDFSSRGFEGDGFILKPDIAAMGAGVTYATSSGEFATGNGTSFSSPIIAGMAACLVAYYPEKNSSEIIELIRKLGNLHPSHNVEYGFGIPDFSSIVEAVTNRLLTTNDHETTYAFPNPFYSSFTLMNTKEYHTIEMYSIEGRKVYTTLLHENFTEISSPILSNLNKGVYFAVIKGDHKVQTFKLIKY